MPKKIVALEHFNLLLTKVKEYVDKLAGATTKRIDDLENKITDFNVKDKTTQKVYSICMDNGAIYFDDGEE